MNYIGTVTRVVGDEGVYATVPDLGGSTDFEFGPMMILEGLVVAAGDVVLLCCISNTYDTFVVVGPVALPPAEV